MTLTTAVRKAIKASGLKPYVWAAQHGIGSATLHDLLRKGTAAGRTLAKLQRAGVRVATRKVIASLDGSGETSAA